MYRNHWVISDVQFRKGASIPPFWVGLGWADCQGIFFNVVLALVFDVKL
jgi:hypothetical protein